jgi:hypothetical protein
MEPSSNDTPLPNTEQMTHDHAVRQRRLGRACDACSKRKVKCGDVVPCRNCISLGVQCTFARPAKRRGPANRVAEDLKRARFEVNDLNSAPGVVTSPVAPTIAGAVSGYAAPTAPMGPPAGAAAYPNLDSIAPAATVSRMVYDFFTYVYPVLPFPHEHLVMDRLRKREDVQNRSFCALISALLATLASLFPRIAHTALSELEQNGHVLANDVFIGRCMLVCEQSRGPLTSGRDVDDAATAFFIGIVSYARRQLRLVDLYMAEALSIVRYLGVESNGVLADGIPADHVTKELCRRIYWAIYDLDRYAHLVQLLVATFTNQLCRLQQGTGRSGVVPPSKTSQLPPLPLSTDDYYIYVDRIQLQPQGQLSTLDGFNLTNEIYRTTQPLLRFGLLDDDVRGWESTQAQISSTITSISKELEAILANGHPELTSLPNPRVFELEDPAPSQQARMHVRWELQKILLRIAVVTTQVHMAELLATQVTDETRDDLKKLVAGCARSAKELATSVSYASREPLMKLIAGPFDRTLRELTLVAGLVGEEASVEEVVRLSGVLVQAE